MALERSLSIARTVGIKKTFGIWQRLGVHVVVSGYYSPIPDTRTLTDEVMNRRSDLVGIDMRESSQLELADRFASGFAEEYDALPHSPTDVPYQFYLGNQNFRSVDAEVLYSMIRHLKPARIIEIGSGDSTRLIARAVRKNSEEGTETRFTAIDPFPVDVVEAGIPGLAELDRRKVEHVPLEAFEELGPDDILFIDSSHVVKMGGDVVYEYLEILPRLSPGVVVHVPDVYLPALYPRHYVENMYFLNEQYMLQAFLALNDSFEVVWASHFMHLEHPEVLKAAFRSYGSDLDLICSFWMRRTR